MSVVCLVSLHVAEATEAGLCPEPKAGRVVAGGRFACIGGQFYACKHGAKGWRWQRFAPMCPVVDPLPGNTPGRPPPSR